MPVGGLRWRFRSGRSLQFTVIQCRSRYTDCRLGVYAICGDELGRDGSGGIGGGWLDDFSVDT